MSSTESPALSAQRSKQAKQEVPKAIDQMTNSYLAAIRQRKPSFLITTAFESELRAEIEGMMRAAAK